jgi:hypothetical protein
LTLKVTYNEKDRKFNQLPYRPTRLQQTIKEVYM